MDNQPFPQQPEIRPRQQASAMSRARLQRLVSTLLRLKKWVDIATKWSLRNKRFDQERGLAPFCSENGQLIYSFPLSINMDGDSLELGRCR